MSSSGGSEGRLVAVGDADADSDGMGVISGLELVGSALPVGFAFTGRC